MSHDQATVKTATSEKGLQNPLILFLCLTLYVASSHLIYLLDK